MGVIDLVPVVRSIVPPKRSADEDTHQAWRWAVFYVVLAIGSVLTVHILWACGVLPWVAGFANAADLARLDARAKRIEVRMISAELYDARREQCAATTGDMEAIKPGAMRRLNALEADYEAMTGFSYRIADCDEF